MELSCREIQLQDRIPLIDIFNYYIKETFAAYPEKPVPYEAFDLMMTESAGYPALVLQDPSGTAKGFVLLRPYNRIPTFGHCAVISCFIEANQTGQGAGKMLYETLFEAAKERGLDHILAGVSSENRSSLRFHLRMGFVECGRFPGVLRKHGRSLDEVWLIREL
ncbi:MAG: N-acetyltransferase family protein [Desulfovibrionaceae bacterium]